MRRPSRTGKALVALALTASLTTAQVSAPAPAQAQQLPAFQTPTLPQFNEEQVRQAITALVALAAGIGGLALLADGKANSFHTAEHKRRAKDQRRAHHYLS